MEQWQERKSELYEEIEGLEHGILDARAQLKQTPKRIQWGQFLTPENADPKKSTETFRRTKLLDDSLLAFLGYHRGAEEGVAYFAHLGGFAVGFGVAWLMRAKGWVMMEKYEKSLLQFWKEWSKNGNDEKKL